MLRIVLPLLLLIAATTLFWQWPASSGNAPDSAATDKPVIALMTSLPVIWGEAASMTEIISGKAVPEPIYAHWQIRYKIEAVDSFETLPESGTDLIILAQPNAMDPADIAAVDDWIRAGGRAIILTDPMLVWPTELPLGDARRPLATGLLSPLLSHWGLELLAPDDIGSEVVELELDDLVIVTAGIGTFGLVDQADGSKGQCALSAGRVLAHCEIGDGQVILIADADFLNSGFWSDDREWNASQPSNVMKLTDRLVAKLIGKTP